MIRFYRDHHPFDRFGPANAVTMVRATLVVVMATIGSWPPPGSAIAAGAIAGVVAALYGLDGYLARRTGMASAFGARFDMETDAAFLLVLSGLLVLHGKAG